MAKKILLVEDEPLLSNLLKQRLEKEGMEVFQAHDGEEALSFLRTSKPDLIILDIILPKVSGFEVLQFLQSDPQLEKAPVIIASNLGQEADVNKGRGLGAVQYFVKAKMSIEDLVNEVKKAVSEFSVIQ